MTDPDDLFEDWLDRNRVEPLGPIPGTYERVARTVRRRQIVRVTATTALVAVLVAGLTGLTGLTVRIVAGPRPVPPPAASASRSPSPSTSPSSIVSPSTSSRSPGPSASSASSQSVRCHVDELKISVQASPGGGAAGSVYSLLVFTNVSGRTCTLYGYPGVSWVKGPAGPQVNDPFRRSAGGTPDRVVLAPDGAAHALIQLGHPEAFEPQCHAVDVYGVRVYPPDETNSVIVAWASTTCSTNGIDVGIIYPIVTGPSN